MICLVICFRRNPLPRILTLRHFLSEVFSGTSGGVNFAESVRFVALASQLTVGELLNR